MKCELRFETEFWDKRAKEFWDKGTNISWKLTRESVDKRIGIYRHCLYSPVAAVVRIEHVLDLTLGSKFFFKPIKVTFPRAALGEQHDAATVILSVNKYEGEVGKV